MAENKHRLVIDERTALMAMGVTDVEGFDDTRVMLTGSFGSLDISGEDLKIAALDLEQGKVSISGRIDALAYGVARAEKKMRNKSKKALSRLLK